MTLDREEAGRPGPSPREVFSEIYARGVWGMAPDGGFDSGGGSGTAVAGPYVDLIERELRDATASETIVDVGCGDFRVGRLLVDRLPVRYVGVDVVPELISHHVRNHSSERVQFVEADVTVDPIPAGDYCLVRQVFQHLSNAQIQLILPKLRGFRRVFVSEHYPYDEADATPNLDKVCGADVRAPGSAVYLDQPPFGLRTRDLLTVPLVSDPAFRPDVVRTFELLWPER